MGSLPELDRRLERLRRGVARLEGRRDQLKAREDELARSVGLAKGRAALKPKVDAFLEGLQAAAHERTVGSYSKLLTALARDVLPQDLEIGLDLYTERGLPALDIFARRGEERVDLLEGCGGSLTNVVSLGLRTIATVKSGMRSFLALDEPDCWVKPDRVPAFYRVLKQMAERMGFQALVISHHDVGLFDSGINVIAVSGTPEAGLSVDVRSGAAAWPDDEAPGIRALVMRNFASYADARIPLSPGVNAIIGDNNVGKSRVMRMLRSVAYAGTETSDDDIRHGERRAEVEIHLERGRVLHWSREIRRSPVTLWRLVEADGSLATVDSARCEAGGRQAPEWVAKTLGIARLDGLDIQLAHQKFPVFLLGEPPSKRAAVLSVGRESGHLRAMIAAHRDNCARDQVAVKTGEREVAEVRRQLAALDGLPGAAELIEAAGRARQRHADGTERAAAVEAVGIRIAGARRALARAEAEAAALGDLPEEPPVPRPSDDVASAGRRIRDAARALKAREAEALALSDLPDELPALRDPRETVAAIERIARLEAALAEAGREARAAAEEEAAAALAVAETLAAIGNHCPMCGSHVGHEHILAAGTAAAETAQ